MASWAFALAVAPGCASERARPRRPVLVAVPDSSDAVVSDSSWTEMAHPEAGPVDASPPAPGPRPLAIYLRVRDEPWERGVRAALEPPQHPAGLTPGDLPEGLVPVVDFRGPASPGAETLARLLAAGRTATALYHSAGRPLETDTRHLAAFVFDDPKSARWDDRPLLFLETPEALPALAQLPRPPAVLLALDPAAPDEPAGPGAALVIGRYASRSAAYAGAGGGDPPGFAEARVFEEARAFASARGAWLPLARASRNGRLLGEMAAVEPPGTEQGLLRALVLARRSATEALLVDGLGAWTDDRQLDPLSPAETTDRPVEVTAGTSYPSSGDTRLRLVREAVLDTPLPAGDVLAEPPDLALLSASDSVRLRRLEQVGDEVAVELEDTTAGGRCEVLLTHRPFMLPAGARLRYERSDPALRLELELRGGPEDPLQARTADSGQRVDLDLGDLAGAVVESVVLLYGGGTGRLQATVSRPRLE